MPHSYIYPTQTLETLLLNRMVWQIMWYLRSGTCEKQMMYEYSNTSEHVAIEQALELLTNEGVIEEQIINFHPRQQQYTLTGKGHRLLSIFLEIQLYETTDRKGM